MVSVEDDRAGQRGFGGAWYEERWFLVFEMPFAGPEDLEGVIFEDRRTSAGSQMR